MYTRGIPNVVDSPQEVIPDGVIDVDSLVSNLFSSDLCINIIQGWTEEGVDVECPIKPPS
jgi:hypothetical protein